MSEAGWSTLSASMAFTESELPQLERDAACRQFVEDLRIVAGQRE